MLANVARAEPGTEPTPALTKTWTESKLRFLDQSLRSSGLLLRGGFHPDPSDRVPLPNGARAETVVLIGNAGGAMWDRFQAERSGLDERNPLDRWLESIQRPAADAAGAHLILTNKGPPFVPIIEWAMRAEAVYRSPIGITIHPDYGLWHAYRGVLLFAERLVLPPRCHRPNPCATCAARPCLGICPADAFLADRFDIERCFKHVASSTDNDCRMGGCMARRACPIGQDYAYPREAQVFHTEFTMHAAGRMLARRGKST